MDTQGGHSLQPPMTFNHSPRGVCFLPCSAVHLPCNHGFRFHETDPQVAYSYFIQSFKLTVLQAQRSWFATQGISPRKECRAFWNNKVASGPASPTSYFSYTNLFFPLACFLAGAKADGRWSCWSSWSECRGGSRERRRQCNNPAPQNGGAPCLGKSLQTQAC